MGRETKPKEIRLYEDADGKKPFADWIEGLRDVMGRKRIFARIKRLGRGNFGDCESVGDGICELRLFFGPGYRVYFAEENNGIVILLSGGDKSSQTKDIEMAKSYWKEYKSHA